MKDVNESEVRRLVREAVERALGPGTAPASPGSSPGPVSSPAKAPAPAPAAAPASAARPAPSGERRVAIGSDHGGFVLKQVLVGVLRDDLGWDVHDVGTHSTDAVDYPDFAAAVAREVASGRAARGIVVDAAGIGSSMAANKIPGVRCALAHDDTTAINAREHNDANVLALGARVVNRGLATRLVRLFLTTEFGGGRHARRVLKIMALEGGR
jgi:ribose 5-phosphate isomerase B